MRITFDPTEHPAQLHLPGDVEVICGLPRGFLASRRAVGNGPRYVKVGHRTIVYCVKDVREWLASHAVEPGARRRQGAA
jgi:hypothetical protein